MVHASEFRHRHHPVRKHTYRAPPLPAVYALSLQNGRYLLLRIPCKAGQGPALPLMDDDHKQGVVPAVLDLIFGSRCAALMVNRHRR